MVPQLLVDNALIGMGERAGHIMPDKTYFVAVSLVRVAGVLFLAFAMVSKILVKQGWTIENLRLTLTIVAINVLIWGGSFIFMLSTKSVASLLVSGLALLIWLIIPALLIFEYKKTEDWKSVRSD